MMAACYSMDLYCDVVDASVHRYGLSMEQFIGETFNECKKEAKKRGWVFKSDGTHVCPKHSGKTGSAVPSSPYKRRKPNDLSGKKFGRLTAIKLLFTERNSGNKYRWECVCDCGNTRLVRSNSLLKGDTKSCGCLRTDFTHQRKPNRRMRMLLDAQINESLMHPVQPQNQPKT